MREIDPFSYFAGQASAIAGFGGETPPADARYCFHTDYVYVRPGTASYQVRLNNVRATHGILALRVHALRREHDANAIFVAGAHVDVATADSPDLCASVQFVAQRHTHYAFYGQLVKEADIQADAVLVSLDDAQGPDEQPVEPPFSALIAPMDARNDQWVPALLHVVSHHLFAPVSQDCTAMQMVELRALAGFGQGIDDWADAVCFNALRTYGVKGPELLGLVVGHCSDYLSSALADAGYAVRAIAPNPLLPESSDIFGDFLVWPEGPGSEEDDGQRWNAIKAWFGRLKIGGVGIVVCRFRPNGPQPATDAVADGSQVSQFEIERWALRLIAEGYAIAPLAFSSPEEQYVDDAGLCRFALVARRG